MATNFTKIKETDILTELAAGDHLLVESGGMAKRIPASALKQPGMVFETVADMEEYIADHADRLAVGMDLFIREPDAPDYWWDGTQAVKAETDLSGVKADIAGLQTSVEENSQAIETNNQEIGKISQEITEAENKLAKQGEKIGFLSTYVTPEMFGAVGDGVTDDTAAIQAAIDSRKPIYFDRKTYFLKSEKSAENANGVQITYALEAKPNLIMYGNDTIIVSENGILFGNAVSGVVIDGFTFTGNSQTDMMPLIEFDSSSNITVKNCVFKEYYGDGLAMYNSNKIVIRDIKLDDFTGHGISLGKKEVLVSDVEIKNVFVKNQNRYSTDNSSNPIMFTGKNSVISDVVCENCAWGIKVQTNSENVSLRNISFICGENATTNTGVKIQGNDESLRCKNITLCNVSVKNAIENGYAYYISHCDNVRVYGASIENCKNGVRLIDATGVVFDDITFLETALGVYIGDASALVVKELKWIHSGNDYNIISADTDLIRIGSLVVIAPNTTTSSKWISSRSSVGVVNVDSIFSTTEILGRNTIYSGNAIFRNVTLGVVQRFIIVTLSAENPYTDVASNLIIYRGMTGGKILQTLPHIVSYAGANIADAQIKGVEISNGTLRIYHDASTSERKIMVVLDTLVSV